ncbi:hypothetical protein PR048_004348 [Dryococelus australis]|uniref:Uncharacterized protein n=1 Tax=Dryococelus australis TaxID=614101 RepID=A0ABQ9I576_9NEOP|nr:hypothetical protein PR048_004348 [Dryococelus australis]
MKWEIRLADIKQLSNNLASSRTMNIGSIQNYSRPYYCFANLQILFKLWQTFHEDLCEDIRHTDDILNQGLIQIEDKIFELSEKKMSKFWIFPHHSEKTHVLVLQL